LHLRGRKLNDLLEHLYNRLHATLRRRRRLWLWITVLSVAGGRRAVALRERRNGICCAQKATHEKCEAQAGDSTGTEPSLTCVGFVRK
jgi:hypothetical protein